MTRLITRTSSFERKALSLALLRPWLPAPKTVEQIVSNTSAELCVFLIFKLWDHSINNLCIIVHTSGHAMGNEGRTAQRSWAPENCRQCDGEYWSRWTLLNQPVHLGGSLRFDGRTVLKLKYTIFCLAKSWLPKDYRKTEGRRKEVDWSTLLTFKWTWVEPKLWDLVMNREAVYMSHKLDTDWKLGRLNGWFSPPKYYNQCSQFLQCEKTISFIMWLTEVIVSLDIRINSFKFI